LRNRDYTFPEAPPSDSFNVSGGGERFYRFIKTELQPYITRTYRTDTLNNVIMGHSLAGYFVLYSLLKDMQGDHAFDHYVAASPSLWYDNFYIAEQFKTLKVSLETRKRRVYLSSGELEAEEDTENRFKEFGQILSGFELIDPRIKVYEGMEHMGTAIPSFEDGMEFVLGGGQ
jgi:predicted alpha/beta superfamily hydrolase